MAEGTIHIHTPKSGTPKAVCKVDDDGNWYLMVVVDGLRHGIAGSYSGPIYNNVKRGSAGNREDAAKACRQAATQYGIEETNVSVVQPQHAPKLKYGKNEMERIGIDPKAIASKVGERMLPYLPASMISKLLGFKAKRARTASIKRLQKIYNKAAKEGRIKWVQKKLAMVQTATA